MCAAPADLLEGSALEARFVDVICDDEELLAAEFDAIVSAAWRPAQPTRSGPAELRRRRDGPRPLGRTGSSASSPEGTGVPPRARQRSPPSEPQTPSGRTV